MAGTRQNRYLRDIPLPGIDAGPRGYRGPAVCKIVGISYRQLDYWTTTGLVTSSIRSAEGSGSQRLYAFDDIVQLKVIKRLLDTGVSLQRIRAAIEFIRDRGLSLRNVTLMSDGVTVYALDDDSQIVDLLRKGQGVFAIAFEPVVAETESEIIDIPAERAFPATAADQPASEPAPASTDEAAGSV